MISKSFWHGKSVLVTGGSSGIGRAIGLAAVASGSRVGIIARKRGLLCEQGGRRRVSREPAARLPTGRGRHHDRLPWRRRHADGDRRGACRRTAHHRRCRSDPNPPRDRAGPGRDLVSQEDRARRPARPVSARDDPRLGAPPAAPNGRAVRPRLTATPLPGGGRAVGPPSRGRQSHSADRRPPPADGWH